MTETLCRACRTHPAHDAFICEPCIDQLHGDLVQVADIAHELDVEVTKRSHKGRPVGGHGKHDVQPLPFNPTASACADDIRWHLIQLVTITNLGQPPSLPTDTIAGMAYWLDERLHSVAQRDGIEEAINGLGKAITKARRVIDLAPEKIYIGHCECWEIEPADDHPGRKTRLYARSGERMHRCHRCHHEWDAAEKFDQLHQELADYGLTHRELETLLPRVPRATLHRWIKGDNRRGQAPKLRPQGTTAEGEPVYRYGDVLELDARRTARRTETAA